MILYEDMKPIEHVLLHPICVYFITWCTYANTVIWSHLYITEHIAVTDEFIASKTTDLTWFFISKSRHSGRMKKKTDLGGKKPQWEPWSHAEKHLFRQLESEHLGIYCRVIVTQARLTVKQSDSKFRNLSAGTGAWTWANCNLIIAYLNKLSTHEATSMVIPIWPFVSQSLNWSAGCQIASVLTFMTGASANLKRGHVKRFAVALSV